MKLLVELIRCNDCVRSITDALLKLDLGARIRFPEANQVSVEGRLTLPDAAQAIEARGFRVAHVLDPALFDTGVDAQGRAKPWSPGLQG
jgi:hypothetical protein